MSGVRRPAATALLVITAALLITAAVLITAGAAADDGWVIERFASDIEIQRDGRLLITEAIDVDFQQLNDRHGIFRDIPVRYRWDPDPKMVRVYDVAVLSVRDANGRGLKYETSENGANYRIKVGDADRIVVGKQTYRIAYTVRGALNAFADHDELFWNVNGGSWSVPMRAVSATVHTTFDAFTTVTCFEGVARSTKPCQSSVSPQRAAFSATTALPTGQQLTIVTALQKGAVTVPAPMLQREERGIDEYFDVTPTTMGAALLTMIGGVGLVVWRWLTAGRDERERETIVAEYEPPEKLRPAQVGLLVDEHADTKDATATIVDLAVRGYLTITELPATGIFGKKDWTLTRIEGKADPAALQPYERTIYDGLFGRAVMDVAQAKVVALVKQLGDRFGAGPTIRAAFEPRPTDEVQLSALKEHFYTTLAIAQRELYGDSVARKWFPADPQRVRQLYAALGCVAIVGAGVLVFVLGSALGAGLVGLGAVVPAVALLGVASRMPRKTRAGAELLRRTLGFRHYMEIAEKERQRFAERENIFSQYLPYAIVFGCVEKWARAFSDIDATRATAGWYSGTTLGAFSASDLSDNLSSFSNQVSSTIASTPGGSGGSGFSGGGSGGGGGGGGGGSW
ncbi:MAG TPA: DUF2207 domain-containing protein [Candidatus Limnocylindria bacterium]|nr:DUF2207 domain-containing protein [Candidatus Limnocylindria bacterium]